LFVFVKVFLCAWVFVFSFVSVSEFLLEFVSLFVMVFSYAPGCQPNCFTPNTITIGTGGEVVWKNNDNTVHTAVSGDPRNGLNGFFDSSIINTGQEFSHKFYTSGSYNYFCMIHPWMEGKIVVKVTSSTSMPTQQTQQQTQQTQQQTQQTQQQTQQTQQQTQQTQQQTQQSKGGGCLIATAAFGSELDPQVQFLRELRDNTVLQTESGSAFMTGFNQFYYSFSPAIADYERENPVFKEAVKLTLTPLLTSLTLLQYADIDSESEMLGYGISIILLNIGMYFVAPAVLIMRIRKR